MKEVLCLPRDATETRWRRDGDAEATRAMLAIVAIVAIDASREGGGVDVGFGRSFLDAIRCRSPRRAVSSSPSSSRPSQGTSWGPSVHRACPTARARSRRGVARRRSRHHRDHRNHQNHQNHRNRASDGSMDSA